MDEQHTRQSKFLSLLLRHQPEAVGLHLSADGWASIADLVRLTAGATTPLSESVIRQITASSDKQRFVISPDGSRIRANQGHSVTVDLGLIPVEPPEHLYHGTATRFLDSILQQGLNPGSRQHVHLSPDVETAIAVGRRHGSPVVLRVDSIALHRAGGVFHRSENGVWLIAHVPAQYLSRI